MQNDPMFAGEQGFENIDFETKEETVIAIYDNGEKVEETNNPYAQLILNGNTSVYLKNIVE